MMMANKFRSALTTGIALAVVLAVAPKAYALDGYWHGERSSSWSDGSDGTKSNWYTEAPPNGDPVNVPDGTAIFAPGALRSVASVSGKQTVVNIWFSPGGTDQYTFNIPGVNGPDTLTINGGEVSNESAVDQLFFIGNQGRLILLGGVLGGIDPDPQNTILVYNSIGGRTVFRNDSFAIATHIVNNKGGIAIFQDKSIASGCRFTNNGKGATIIFEDKSKSFNVMLNNITGKVVLKPKKRKKYDFGNIVNQSKISIGRNQLNASSFVMTSASRLVFNMVRPKTSGMAKVRGGLHVDGNVTIQGAASWRPGHKYLLMKGKPLTGRFKKLKYASFSKSVKPVLVYKRNSVIVKIKKK
jgi:hypothetical protein